MTDQPAGSLAPYKGLIPYTEADAPFFFGREHEKSLIIANLIATRLTVLYGPSGAGKSSLLRAGVVHTLNQYAQHDSKNYRGPELAVIVFSNWRDDPAVGLALAVQDRLKPTLAALNQPAESLPLSRELLPALDLWAQRSSAKLLVILDQFEEYFLYQPQEDGENTFAVEFPRAVSRPDLRVNFLLSLREDALSKLDRFKGRIPNLFGNYLRIAPLTRESARDAITKPLEEYNRRQPAAAEPVSIEPALVEQVLEQVRTGRVTLARDESRVVESEKQPTDGTIETSYLQLVMERLWNEEMSAGSRTLRLETLTRLKGAENIVRTHLDTVMGGLPPTERDIAAEVLRYLVTPSGTKIAYTLTDLADYAKKPAAQLGPVLEILTGSRLRILRTVEPPPDQPQETRYEIFHDVLAPAVLDWRGRYVQERDRLELVQRLALEAEQQQQELKRAQQLKELEDARKLAESEARLAEKQIQAERERQELLQAQKQRELEDARKAADAQARSALGLRRWVLALASVLILAVAATLFALNQAQSAAEQTRIAEASRLATSGTLNQNSQFDLALLLGVEALRIKDTSEVRSVLLSLLQSHPQLSTFLHQDNAGANGVAFSPNGKRVASANSDRTIRLWDVATRQPIGRPLVGHLDVVTSIAFSPDGTILASGSADSTIILWDVATQQPIGRPLAGHKDAVTSVAFSPTGQTLASGSADRTIILWDVGTQRAIGPTLAGHKDAVTSVAFSPDGQTLASGSADRTVILWDVATQQAVASPLTAHTNAVTSVAFSPDGQTLASGGADRAIILWDMATQQPKGPPLTAHTNAVTSVAFSPDGKTLASGSTDNTLILWDVAAQRPVGQPLAGHSDAVTSVAFSPDGQTLASGSADNTIILWDVRNSPRIAQPLADLTRPVTSIAFSPDDKILASGNLSNTIILWGVATHQPIGQPLDGHTAAVTSVAFSPDGKILASGNLSNTIILWDVATHQPIGAPLAGQNNAITSVAFSPDGKTLASGSTGRTIILWDVAAQRPVGQPLAGHSNAITSVAFSPDGKTLASGSADNTIILWDVVTQRPVGAPLAAHKDAVTSVAFSPNGKTLASGSADDTIILWDVATQRPLGQPLTGHLGRVTSVVFSPDGQTLVSGSYDASLMLWDVATRRPIGQPLTGHKSGVTSVAFSHQGQLLASGSQSVGSTSCSVGHGPSQCPPGELYLWDVNPAAWQRQACEIANRDLNAVEWAHYITSVPYGVTCDGSPIASLPVTPTPMATTGPQEIEVQHFAPRVMVLIFDPVSEATGQRLSQVMGWNRADDLIPAFIADIDDVSGGTVKYQVVERIVVDKLPAKADGFVYNTDDYVKDVQSGTGFHTPDDVDYNKILSQYGILQRVADDHIDEVWAFVPPYAGFYESRMVGQGAFFDNAPPLEASGPRFVIMGFNYQRGVGEMLLEFVSRATDIMRQVYGSKSGSANLFERFTLYDKIAPGQANVGIARYAPNSVRDYDWGNTTPVLSAADDWLQFPNLPSPPRYRPMSAKDWGGGDIRLYQLWWLRHLPKVGGATDGISNNWWRYIVNPNSVP